ncbi:MAG: hypothetical protein H7A51_03425 [Akkermansiaceae bacterium]|nr:hypothetical protein [Akkermansiaceae bacterium]
MKKYISLLLFLSVTPFLQARDITPKWRDTMEMKELDKARKTAESEKKLITILVTNKTYDSDTQGAQQVVDVIEDTIKALKTSSIIVRTSYEEAGSLNQGDEFNMAVIDGLRKAGNSLPMIIVINPIDKKLVQVIPPNEVLQDGSKAFRDVKKAARNLKKK